MYLWGLQKLVFHATKEADDGNNGFGHKTRK